jgi:hypothetical protein
MRLPKTINIGGKKYAVRRDERQPEGNGSFDTYAREIMVGSKHRRPEIAFETFVHEVIETILIENTFRYHRDGYPDEFIYTMNHNEMSRLADDVACAIRPMLKG